MGGNVGGNSHTRQAIGHTTAAGKTAEEEEGGNEEGNGRKSGGAETEIMRSGKNDKEKEDGDKERRLMITRENGGQRIGKDSVGPIGTPWPRRGEHLQFFAGRPPLPGATRDGSTDRHSAVVPPQNPT